MVHHGPSQAAKLLSNDVRAPLRDHTRVKPGSLGLAPRQRLARSLRRLLVEVMTAFDGTTTTSSTTIFGTFRASRRVVPGAIGRLPRTLVRCCNEMRWGKRRGLERKRRYPASTADLLISVRRPHPYSLSAFSTHYLPPTQLIKNNMKAFTIFSTLVFALAFLGIGVNVATSGTVG